MKGFVLGILVTIAAALARANADAILQRQHENLADHRDGDQISPPGTGVHRDPERMHAAIGSSRRFSQSGNVGT